MNLIVLLKLYFCYRNDFMNYAEFCFWEFGDRVKYWTTLNEPQSYSNKGYALGTFAPGRGGEGEPGNPAIEPYIVAHNLLLCHANVVNMYRQRFQVMHSHFSMSEFNSLVLVIFFYFNSYLCILSSRINQNGKIQS